jgi:hypothetical protein
MAQTEQLRKNLTQPGILAALGAALLFGSGTPLAKLLLADVSPWLMAALLYLGSGIGLTLYRLLRRAPAVRLPRGEWPWLTGAIFAGGVLGPGLQMLGFLLRSRIIRIAIQPLAFWRRSQLSFAYLEPLVWQNTSENTAVQRCSDELIISPVAHRPSLQRMGVPQNTWSTLGHSPTGKSIFSTSPAIPFS